jgi:phospho-N-acetylmuramoyl-pentapeptide-transferase
MASPLVLIALLSFLLVLLPGGAVIRLLKRVGAGQRVRDDGPQRHLEKEGTPTMGGVLFVPAAVAAALLGVHRFAGHIPMGIAVLMAATLAFWLIGFADDWLKIKRGRSLGLKAREKLAMQIVVAVLTAYALARVRAEQGMDLDKPYSHTYSLYWLYWMPFWVPLTVWTSNAVNLADGLDGLATGLCTIAALGFVTLGLAHGHHEVSIVAAALAGACLGFLWYNRHPARVFMGDVGSLALGGMLAVMAAMLTPPGPQVAMPVMALLGFCLVPYIEAASVVAQVISFKTTGKRIFKMSPIHHHFELSGWSEQRVVWAFWGVAAAGAMVTVLVYGRW